MDDDAKDKAETGPMQGPGLFLSGPSLAGRAQFEEPRWPLSVALNWLAFGDVDLLTIEDDARRLRFQAALYGSAGDRIVKNPHVVLRRALADGAIAAVGPDNKDLSPEDWDMIGFDWRLWPAVRFRREDILRLRRELADEPSPAPPPPDSLANKPPRVSDAELRGRLLSFLRDFQAECARMGDRFNQESAWRAAEKYFKKMIGLKQFRMAYKNEGFGRSPGRPRKSGQKIPSES